MRRLRRLWINRKAQLLFNEDIFVWYLPGRRSTQANSWLFRSRRVLFFDDLSIGLFQGSSSHVVLLQTCRSTYDKPLATRLAFRIAIQLLLLCFIFHPAMRTSDSYRSSATFPLPLPCCERNAGGKRRAAHSRYPIRTEAPLRAQTKTRIENAPRAYHAAQLRIRFWLLKISGFLSKPNTLLRTSRRRQRRIRRVRPIITAVLCRSPDSAAVSSKPPYRRWRPSSRLATERYVKDQRPALRAERVNYSKTPSHVARASSAR